MCIRATEISGCSAGTIEEEAAFEARRQPGWLSTSSPSWLRMGGLGYRTSVQCQLLLVPRIDPEATAVVLTGPLFHRRRWGI